MKKRRSIAPVPQIGFAAVILGLLAISLVLPMGCYNAGDSGSGIERVDALYLESKQDFPEVPDISAAELMDRMKSEKIVFVDDREEAEWDVSMIPGAITTQEFESEIEKYTDATVVAYCTIGDRSGHYTRDLREKGIDAYNLQGGVLAWSHAGGKFVDDEGNKTNRVHVYGSKWNHLAEGYVAVW